MANETKGALTLQDVRDRALAGTWIAWYNVPTTQDFSATNAWYAGGYTATISPAGTISKVDRIIFASDTATAVAKGPLSSSRYMHAATGNTTDAWYGGGAFGPSIIDSIERIIFASDTATAVSRGKLSPGATRLAAHGNTTDGWYGCGANPGALSSTTRITFSIDLSLAVQRGPLSTNIMYLSATGNMTDAYFGGGFYPYSAVSTVDRIIFSVDTATAVTKGPLSANRYQLAAHGNTTDAWYVGGTPSLPSGGIPTSTVQRIIFSVDTATAVTKGPLSGVKRGPTAGGNTTDAWIGGGLASSSPSDSAGYPTTVDRIIFSSDTATAAVRGPLSSGRYGLAAN